MDLQLESIAFKNAGASSHSKDKIMNTNIWNLCDLFYYIETVRVQEKSVFSWMFKRQRGENLYSERFL